MIQITLKTQNFELKQGTKTAYKLIDEQVKQITEEQYRNIVESASFFRRIGSCRQTKGYTCYGYKVVRDVATSPDRQYKTVREFDFQYLPN